jgi:hypothetical protein
LFFETTELLRKIEYKTTPSKFQIKIASSEAEMAQVSDTIIDIIGFLCPLSVAIFSPDKMSHLEISESNEAVNKKLLSNINDIAETGPLCPLRIYFLSITSASYTITLDKVSLTASI